MVRERLVCEAEGGRIPNGAHDLRESLIAGLGILGILEVPDGAMISRASLFYFLIFGMLAGSLAVTWRAFDDSGRDDSGEESHPVTPEGVATEQQKTPEDKELGEKGARASSGE